MATHQEGGDHSRQEAEDGHQRPNPTPGQLVCLQSRVCGGCIPASHAVEDVVAVYLPHMQGVVAVYLPHMQ